jgi:hypothetical protein
MKQAILELLRAAIQVEKNYLFVAENCKNMKGKPCRRCAAILRLRKAIEQVKAEGRTP